VVTVRTEREPNRYEPLNETHRRVAEEEEKRRLAEQDQARSAQPEAAATQRASEPEPLTAEAIKRDARNAVRLDIPEDTSIELLGIIVETARDLRRDAEDRAIGATSIEETEQWRELASEADERFDDALVRWDKARAHEAWQAPTFSRETIKADPWTAVYLPIPEDADLTLLTEAQNWARDLVRYSEGERDGALSKPLVSLPSDALEPHAAATARLAELDEREVSQLSPNRPGPEPRPNRSETTPEHDPDSPEARLAAMQKELEEKVRLGRINSSEMIHQLRQFDNQLRVEMEEAGVPPPTQQRDLSGNSRDEMMAGGERVEPQSPQRVEAAPDHADDQSRERPSERVPETRIEREAQAAEYEIVGRAEMTDVRASRLERLRGIDREIERENRENEGKGPDLDHDSGDHSR
jgi:hypothetical protein